MPQRNSADVPDNVSMSGTVGLGEGAAGFGNNSRAAGSARDPYGTGQQYNPRINGQEVMAVRRDQSTHGITAFQLADGSVLDYDSASMAVANGQAEGLVIQSNQYGPFIKTKPDGSSGNNLDSMPTF